MTGKVIDENTVETVFCPTVRWPEAARVEGHECIEICTTLPLAGVFKWGLTMIEHGSDVYRLCKSNFFQDHGARRP